MLLFVTKNMARTRKLRQRQDDIVSYQFWTMTDRCLHAFVGSTPPMNKNVSFCIFFFFSLKIKIFIVLVCLWSNVSFNLFYYFAHFRRHHLILFFTSIFLLRKSFLYRRRRRFSTDESKSIFGSVLSCFFSFYFSSFSVFFWSQKATKEPTSC